MHFQIIYKLVNSRLSGFLFILSQSIQQLDIIAVSFRAFCQVFTIVRMLDKVQRKMLVYVSL